MRKGNIPEEHDPNKVQWLLTVNRQTCENFEQLAKRGYYNGLIFHRIIAVRHDESRLLDFFSYFTYCHFQRILWFRVAIRLGQVKEVPAYMDKSCTSHSQSYSPLLHRTTDTNPNHPNPPIYSSHWQRRRDPSRTTVHRCRNLRNGQLGTKHQ